MEGSREVGTHMEGRMPSLQREKLGKERVWEPQGKSPKGPAGPAASLSSFLPTAGQDSRHPANKTPLC